MTFVFVLLGLVVGFLCLREGIGSVLALVGFCLVLALILFALGV